MEARSELEERQTRWTPILHVFPIARVRHCLLRAFLRPPEKRNKKKVIITPVMQARNGIIPAIKGCQETMGRFNKVLKRT